MAFTWTPWLLDSLAKGDAKHPFSDEHLDKVRGVLAPAVHWGVDQGQPFHLEAIQHVATLAGDQDSQFPSLVKGRVDLGVDSPTWNTPGIWPTKEEMRGMEWVEEEPPKLSAKENYQSAEQHKADLEATFLEERDLDMVDGPYTKLQAAKKCGCSPEKIIHGPMAAKEIPLAWGSRCGSF